MARLVTLAQAKRHLRVPEDVNDNNTDIDLKVIHASEIVIDYLKDQGDPTWTDVTVPKPVQSAMLLMLTHLYENRGENMAPDEAVWTAVGNLLVRFRDPALA